MGNHERCFYPVQLAEYVHQRKVSEEPAFAWWVPHVLKKRNRIISKVKSKYWTRTHKFGIRIPKDAEEAKRLDMGYRPSRANPDVWLRPGIKEDGYKYWEMILCYVDDVLAIAITPKRL